MGCELPEGRGLGWTKLLTLGVLRECRPRGGDLPSSFPGSCPAPDLAPTVRTWARTVPQTTWASPFGCGSLSVAGPARISQLRCLRGEGAEGPCKF